jgi:hypothetical protein
MSYIPLTPIQLRVQHQILQVIIDRKEYHNKRGTPAQSRWMNGHEIVSSISLLYTIKEISAQVNHDEAETTMLLNDLKFLGYISIYPSSNYRCGITYEGKTAFGEQRIKREADKIDEDNRKERLARRISIANVVIPILTFLLPIIVGYFISIEPLQKELRALKVTNQHLKTENQHLLKASKHK